MAVRTRPILPIVILVNITATMSDRTATEVKFNTLLEDRRKDVLPQVKENWEQLSAADQLAVSQLLFCGLHGLVHFAKAASTSLVELDRCFWLSLIHI